MIPKVIHYCWFGRNPKPKLAEKCIKSWKKYCPDLPIGLRIVRKVDFVDRIYDVVTGNAVVYGVTVDELVSYKGKNAAISFEDRIEMVRLCKYVDVAIPQYAMDKLTVCKK